MKVWQIATGEPGRDYRELFFDYDVMIIGPSRDGDARTHNYYDGIPNSIGNQVHNFLTVPAPGDRVLMRYRQQVIGIGEIPQKEEYQYSFNEAFSCVYGWDLAHCRRVIWARDFKLGKLADAFRGATRKPTFTQIHDPHTVEMVEAIKASHFQRPIRKLPRLDTSLYTEEEFGVELFHAGISNKNIEDIFKAIRQAE